MIENELSGIVRECCFKIHRTLGPGLFESVYEAVLLYELLQCGVPHQKQVGIPVKYEDIELDLGFRADIIVANKVILEHKSVTTVLPVHKKQLLTYLRLTGLKLGLLINFNVHLMKDGITRIANKL